MHLLEVHHGASLILLLVLFNLQEVELGLFRLLPLAWGLTLPIARNLNSSIKTKVTLSPIR
jgi:hypothetical protein